MIRHIFLILTLTLTLGGCAKKSEPVRTSTPVVSKSKPPVSPYGDGKTRTEPVFFNGNYYNVSLTHKHSHGLYDVVIAGKGGRKLGGTTGDRKVVQNLASSTVRHFACKNSQKAHILPGSARHRTDKWALQARCR